MLLSRPRLLLALLLASVVLNLYWWVGARSPAKQPAPETGRWQALPAEGGTAQSIIYAPATDPALDAEDLQLLFEVGDFADALAGLAWLAGELPGEAAALKKAWLAQARAWLGSPADEGLAGQFVEAALDSDPNDFEFRRLAAERLAASDDVLRAVDSYYELLNESPQNLQGVLAGDIQKLVKREVEKLEADQAWPLLVRLAERLLWHEPMHPPWVFIYARALAKEARYASAKNALYTVVYDEYYGSKARQMLEEIERLGLAETAVPLRRRGSHYLVSGRINGSDSLALMIDTGATLSVISPSALRAAGVAPAPVLVRNAVINTAGGKVRAPIYRVESFAIGDYTVPNMEFVVLELEDKSVGSGLLGMNFLRNFAFRLDQENSLLYLSSP